MASSFVQKALPIKDFKTDGIGENKVCLITPHMLRLGYYDSLCISGKRADLSSASFGRLLLTLATVKTE